MLTLQELFHILSFPLLFILTRNFTRDFIEFNSAYRIKSIEHSFKVLPKAQLCKALKNQDVSM